MTDGQAGTSLLEGNTRGGDQRTVSDEKTSGTGEKQDPSSLLGKETMDQAFVQTSLFDLPTEVLDFGIEERAFSGAIIKSSEIEPGSKCQEDRSGAGCERVSVSTPEGARRQQKKRKLFSEGGIGPQILE